MTYFCKFDENGKRTETHLSVDLTDEQKADYIEISEEDWNYYVGNNGTGDNGTGYVRGADGKPVSAPAYVPTTEEKKARLLAEYESAKNEIVSYYLIALAEGDTDAQADLQAELSEVTEQFNEDMKGVE